MTDGIKPFGEARYDIRLGVVLESLAVEDAARMGDLFASIDPWKSYPVTAAQLSGFFAEMEPGAPRFAIRHREALVGAVAIRVNWFRGPYIQTFALDPGCQGQGIGSAVMAWVESEARAAGERNLWVAASDFNVRAQAFYVRLGFERVALIDALVRDGRDEILYRKRLFQPDLGNASLNARS